MHFIQHCFIWRPSDSTVSKDPGQLRLRHWLLDALTIRIDQHLLDIIFSKYGK